MTDYIWKCHSCGESKLHSQGLTGIHCFECGTKMSLYAATCRSYTPTHRKMTVDEVSKLAWTIVWAIFGCLGVWKVVEILMN